MLLNFADQFKKLKVDLAHPPPKVHKPCMLLALIDLAESGVLSEKNEIRYEDTLEVFETFAEVVRPGEKLQPFFPFYHLRREPFWKLLSVSNTDDQHLRPTHGAMMGRRASLVPELHKLITTSSQARRDLREALIGHWFPERHDEVHKTINSRRSANEYENELRDSETLASRRLQPENNVRNQSFRRLVIQAYDYRCAATGWRIIIPGWGALVDAAHLIPFKDTHDDRPSNGIALTPTFHRALDRHLIAPAPNMKWRVSKVLDKRIPDNRPLVELDGQPVIFDGDGRHGPARVSLQWRIDHLLKS